MGDGLYDRFNAAFAGVPIRLKADYPEVRAAASLYTRKDRFRLNDKDPNGVEVSVLNADTTIWQVLDLQPLAGNSRNFVSGVGNIAITETFARQYFAGQNPVGKTIYSVPTYNLI
jgi:putative ABC transport system permease protein